MKNRIFAWILAAVMGASFLTGCGGDKAETGSSAPESSADLEVESTEESKEKSEPDSSKEPEIKPESSKEPEVKPEPKPESSEESEAKPEPKPESSEESEAKPEPESSEEPEAKPEPEEPAEPPEMTVTAAGEITEVTLSALPDSLEEFSALLEEQGLDQPAKTCALFLSALELYIEDKDEGIEAMNLLRGPRPMNEYDTQFLRDRLRDKKYLPKAYFDGASPENDYTPEEPFLLKVHQDSRPQDIPDGYIRVFLETAGADSTRPMQLREKDGNWYLWEYSSILSGIRVPAAEDPWA